MRKKDKALLFVEHIEAHLRECFPKDPSLKVICKLCGKDIDQIAKEEEEKVNFS